MVLNPSGIDAAKDFNALRNDRLRRTKAIRRAILKWLYDFHYLGEEASEITDILATDKCMCFGDPLTLQELAREANWLLIDGQIYGHPAFGDVLGLPTITSRGMALMEEETNPAPISRGGGDVYNIHNAGALNWAQNSSGFRQTLTLPVELISSDSAAAPASSGTSKTPRTS